MTDRSSTDKAREQIITALQDMLDGSRAASLLARCGICSRLAIAVPLPEFTDKVTDHIALWPEGSGCEHYPVPGDVPGHRAACVRYNATHDLWEDTSYGDRRRALARWLLDELLQGGIL